MITPRNRRIRATSQLKFSNEKFFKIKNSSIRAKSKEFRNHNITKIKEDSKEAERKTTVEIDPLGKPPSSERFLWKGKRAKNPENSNEIVTAHSSKPQSNLQSDKKCNKRNNSSKNYKLPPKIISVNMNDLK